jgi:Domain of unknown function (DUF5348)
MNNETHTLVASSNRGRYALDTADGRDMTSGQPLEVCLNGQWFTGRVEHDSGGYYFVGDYVDYFKSWDHVGHAYLFTGMTVRLPE